MLPEYPVLPGFPLHKVQYSYIGYTQLNYDYGGLL